MTVKRCLVLIFILSAIFLKMADVSEGADKAAAKDGANVTQKSPVNVTSDWMEAVKDENRVVFKGNVVAVEDFTLCSDELYVDYDDKKEVKEITAVGNVTIIQDDKIAYSDKAVYDRSANTVVLTGRPQVKQCEDTVRGNKITLYKDKDNAVVESGGDGRVRAYIMPDKKCDSPVALPKVKGTSEEARCKRSREDLQEKKGR